jgi:hypothetical protein
MPMKGFELPYQTVSGELEKMDDNGPLLDIAKIKARSQGFDEGVRQERQRIVEKIRRKAEVAGAKAHIFSQQLLAKLANEIDEG